MRCCGVTTLLSLIGAIVRYESLLFKPSAPQALDSPGESEYERGADRCTAPIHDRDAEEKACRHAQRLLISCAPGAWSAITCRAHRCCRRCPSVSCWGFTCTSNTKTISP